MGLNKHYRNAPCRCGSGKKYKRCCEEGDRKMAEEKKIITGQDLKNEFRKEVEDPYAGIPKHELIRRDQLVLLKEQQFRLHCVEIDIEYLKASIERTKKRRVGLQGMLVSPYRAKCLNEMSQYIYVTEQKLENMTPASLVLSTLALEEVLETSRAAKAEKAPLAEQAREDAEAEKELTIPVEDQHLPQEEGGAGEGVDEDEDGAI